MPLTRAAYLSASAIVLVLAAPAWSQTASPPATQPEPQPPAADAPQTGDIIVTAQRREQRLQDVPISVTALSGDQLAATGVSSTHDLQQTVTGITITESSGFVQPFIRGVGTTVTNLGEQGTAAIYIDGVYMPSANGQLYNLANIQSIEVLKGPQGTLFGRNANSGAILITTRAPSFTPEGSFEIGYGNYNAVSARGYVSAPLASDVAAISISGNYDRHDGYYTYRGGDRIGDAYNWSVRGSLLVNATPNFNIMLTGDVMRSQDPAALLLQPVGGYQGYTAGALLPASPYDFIGNTPDVRYPVRQEGVSGRARWDLGGVKLESVTAKRWYGASAINYDSDTTPTLFSQITNAEKGSAFTEELQLSSNKPGPLHWVIGGFYMNQYAASDPLAVTSPTGTRSTTAQQITKAYAGFADATYKLGDIELTGGLRYSDESKRYSAQVNGVAMVNDARAHWDSLTPRVVISYHPNRKLLAYASFSKGFKSGTFNVSSLSSLAVNPETIKAYEIGLKLTLRPGMTFNLAAYHYDIDNLQVQALNPANGLIQVANAARARSQGIDAEFTARPVKDLNLRLGASYLDTKFTSFPNAQVFLKSTAVPDGRNVSIIADVTGNTNVRSPRWTFSASADYEVDLSGNGKIVPSINVYHASSFFWDVGNRLVEPPHTVLNASLTYTLPGDKVSLSVWGRNLTDELRFRTYTPAGQADRRVADDPRTFGVRAGYKF